MSWVFKKLFLSRMLKKLLTRSRERKIGLYKVLREDILSPSYCFKTIKFSFIPREFNRSVNLVLIRKAVLNGVGPFPCDWKDSTSSYRVGRSFFLFLARKTLCSMQYSPTASSSVGLSEC